MAGVMPFAALAGDNNRPGQRLGNAVERFDVLRAIPQTAGGQDERLLVERLEKRGVPAVEDR